MAADKDSMSAKMIIDCVSTWTSANTSRQTQKNVPNAGEAKTHGKKGNTNLKM